MKKPDALEFAVGAGKQSLPAGWRWVRLGEVCDLNPRRPYLDRGDNVPTTFVPMPAVDEREGIIARPEVRPYGEIKKGYTYFGDGDVLFAKITPCMQNGKHAITHGLIDGIGFGSTEFHVMRPTQNICSEWIHYFIRQPRVLHDATAHFTGAVGQQRVPENYLAELEIPLPPLPEQKRIAAILNEQISAVDKARTAAETQLEAAKALPAAYLRQVFPQLGQPLPEGWRWVRLGEVCEIIAGQSPPGNTYRKAPGGLPFFQGKVDFGKRSPIPRVWCIEPTKIARPGDILVSVRAPVGPTNLADRECCIGRGLAAIRSGTKLDTEFLLSWLKLIESELSKLGSGSTFSAISRKDLDNIELPLPPLPEQKRLAEILNEQMAAVEELRASLESQLSEINALFPSLLRKAFNGDL